MIQARRFHSNFLFFIPLTQGVLLVIVLDFCKNAVFFANQVQNLDPTTTTTAGNGQQVQRPKDPAYLAAQYIYALWLFLMMLKAIVGLRANLKFNVRWMGKYNLLFGVDTGFEFIHTTLGVVFQDMSQLDEAAIIRRYCVSFLVLILQLYGFFCCWIHLKWVNVEMSHLVATGLPRESLLGLMFPMAVFPTRRSISSRGGEGSGVGAALDATSELAEVSAPTENVVANNHGSTAAEDVVVMPSPAPSSPALPPIPTALTSAESIHLSALPTSAFNKTHGSTAGSSGTNQIRDIDNNSEIEVVVQR